MSDPQLYFINNVVNGVNLLEVMKDHGCGKFIFSSTAATFGEPEYTPIDEQHDQNPINAYGESKLMFEKILDWYHFAYGFKFNAFRYFNAAGASEKLGEDHRNESHLIPIVLKTALNVQHGRSAEGLKVFGRNYPTEDGTCVRDYIHVVDLAKAHILALQNLDVHPNAKYNMGNGKGFSVLQVKTFLSCVGAVGETTVHHREKDFDILDLTDVDFAQIICQRHCAAHQRCCGDSCNCGQCNSRSRRQEARLSDQDNLLSRQQIGDAS